MEPLPKFKYHPDPVRSGSVAESPKKCKCCRKARGYIYTGPAFAEADLEEALCPWCIADGAAALKYDATFVESDDFPDELDESVVEELTTRTPGYSAWQEQRWFACCGDAMAFVEPAGIAEVRKNYYELEGSLMSNIVYDLQISGGAARRMLESLDRDKGPTAFIFQCVKCGAYKTFVDGVFAIG